MTLLSLQRLTLNSSFVDCLYKWWQLRHSSSEGCIYKWSQLRYSSSSEGCIYKCVETHNPDVRACIVPHRVYTVTWYTTNDDEDTAQKRHDVYTNADKTRLPWTWRLQWYKHVESWNFPSRPEVTFKCIGDAISKLENDAICLRPKFMNMTWSMISTKVR